MTKVSRIRLKPDRPRRDLAVISSDRVIGTGRLPGPSTSPRSSPKLGPTPTRTTAAQQRQGSDNSFIPLLLISNRTYIPLLCSYSVWYRIGYMSGLQDLDSHDLDRMHTCNKKAILELRNLADGRGGSESGDLDGTSGGGINYTSASAVRERTNFLLGLADDNVPISRAHGSMPPPQPTSYPSSHSPVKEKLSATASQIGQAIGRASTKLTHKIRGRGGDDDTSDDDYNLDYRGFGNQSLDFNIAIYC